MKDVNFYLIITIAYIMVFVGMAIGKVGEVIDCNEDPTDWILPVNLFMLLVLPSVFSYLAGRKDIHDE